jgi:acyl dehydratase
MSGKRAFIFDEIVVGEELGPLSYEVTPEKLAAFREATLDPAAVMITIAAKDYAYLLWAEYEEIISINAKHEAWYAKVPVAGDTVTARGRIAERYVRRGRRYLIIETRSVDQHGAELCRNRVTLLMGAVDDQSAG